MYEIKEVIKRLKEIAKVNSNIELAKIFNVSYNTFNTWLKRSKLPQEVIIEFAKKYNASLDYIVFGKNSNLFEFKNHNNNNNKNEFIYYGEFKKLNIKPGAKLKLDTTALFSNGYYLLFKNGIYTIKKCKIDIFLNLVTIDDKKITILEFKEINKGLIKEIKNK